MNALYPIFLSLHYCRCLIVGFGSVGQRKLEKLLECDPLSVMVLDRLAPEELQPKARKLLGQRGVTYSQGTFTTAYLRGCSLVFACTSDRLQNLLIGRLCASKKIFCNCATDPWAGSFIVPGIARSRDLTMAITSNGSSPAFSRILRQELEDWLIKNDTFASLLSKLRQLVHDSVEGTAERQELMSRVAHSPLRHWLQRGDKVSCRQWLNQELPETMRKAALELLDNAG